MRLGHHHRGSAHPPHDLLPTAETERFHGSLAQMFEVKLPIPDHDPLSQRLEELGQMRFRRLPKGRPIHLLIDRKGLRINI